MQLPSGLTGKRKRCQIIFSEQNLTPSKRSRVELSETTIAVGRQSASPTPGTGPVNDTMISLEGQSGMPKLETVRFMNLHARRVENSQMARAPLTRSKTVGFRTDADDDVIEIPNKTNWVPTLNRRKRKGEKLCLGDGLFHCRNYGQKINFVCHECKDRRIELVRCRFSEFFVFLGEEGNFLAPKIQVKKFKFVFGWFHLIVFQTAMEAVKATCLVNARRPARFGLMTPDQVLPQGLWTKGIALSLKKHAHRLLPIAVPRDSERYIEPNLPYHLRHQPDFYYTPYTPNPPYPNPYPIVHQPYTSRVCVNSNYNPHPPPAAIALQHPQIQPRSLGQASSAGPYTQYQPITRLQCQHRTTLTQSNEITYFPKTEDPAMSTESEQSFDPSNSRSCSPSPQNGEIVKAEIPIEGTVVHDGEFEDPEEPVGGGSHDHGQSCRQGGQTHKAEALRRQQLKQCLLELSLELREQKDAVSTITTPSEGTLGDTTPRISLDILSSCCAKERLELKRSGSGES